jgi:phage terminase Nu1 subunit (DNA packaging protein)
MADGVTGKKLAGFLNVSPDDIPALVRQGMPRLDRDEYSSALCAHWYIRHLQTRIENRFLHNKSDTAKLMGVSTQAMSKWDIAPAQRVGREAFFYLPDVIAWRLQRDTAEKLDLTAERARLAKEQADKTAMENEEKRGRLLDTDRVRELWVRVASNIRTNFLGLPTKAAPAVLGCKTLTQVTHELESAIHEILSELSGTDPGTIADRGDAEGVKTAAAPDDQPVGRQRKVSKPRKQRRARKVAH